MPYVSQIRYEAELITAGSVVDFSVFASDEDDDVDAAKRKSTFQQYGVLYNWVAAKQSCPPGWYLPSNLEYNELNRLLGDNAGHKMKSQTGWYE